MSESFNPHGTTILAVRRNGAVSIGGDGQVTLGNTVMKGNARKVRPLGNGKVLGGFAGGTADAFTLFERFEGKLDKFGNLTRAAIELAKDWRGDRYLRRLEALLLVGDTKNLFVISGNGDVIEPDHDVVAIGSGGPFAQAAARALIENTDLDARDHRRAFAEHRRRHLHLHEPQSRHRGAARMTPREIVAELDKHIVGQGAAKRSVAIALRNRWRRMQIEDPLRQEITPKNILMIGPTGCGKTEIARRLARLAKAPFVKVEATKFTEVGYVGREVDSIIKDLAEVAVKMTREEEIAKVRDRAADAAEERLLDALLPHPQDDGLLHRCRSQPARSGDAPEIPQDAARRCAERARNRDSTCAPCPPACRSWRRPAWKKCRSSFRACSRISAVSRTKPRKLKVKEAQKLLVDEEAGKLVNEEELRAKALANAEQNGIVFIDEIDKIARRQETMGADVSREGVQRDLLPLVEGSTVSTKYGQIKTDHILFIASGAFHMSKPSDLIPELQGRFPIRVELEFAGRGRFRAHPHRARCLADRAVQGAAGHRKGGREVRRRAACAASPRSPSA